jgi:hypothetical protein
MTPVCIKANLTTEGNCQNRRALPKIAKIENRKGLKIPRVFGTWYLA